MGVIGSLIAGAYAARAAEDANPGGGASESGGWSIDLNVAGVEAASGKGFGGPQVTRSGVYAVVIKSSSRFTSEGGFDTVKFETVIEGGDFDGYEQGLILPGRPDPDKDPSGKKFKARWKALLLNVVKPETIAAGVLEKNTIKYGTATKNSPIGKKAYVYIRVPAEGDMDKKGYQKRPEAQFMAPAEAQAEIEAEAKLAARRSGNGGGAGTSAGASGTNGGTPPRQPAAPPSAPAADPLAEI